MRQLSRWFRKRISSLVLIGIVLSIVGAIMLGLTDSNNRVLTTAGALLLGAGITVIVSDISSRRAIVEQYAKDANLRRRDTVYGPLEADLKYLRQKLEDSATGQGPYPQVILSSDAVSDSTIFPIQDPTRVILAHWPAFRQNYQRNDFSATTQQLLDEILEAAHTYTAAVKLTHDPIVEALSSSLDAAATATMETETFRAWKIEYDRPERRNAPLGQYPVVENDWFERLLQQPTIGLTFGRALGAAWMGMGHIPIQGWILARSQAQLVEMLHAYFRPDLNTPPPPPKDWIARIVTTAWPDMVEHPSVIGARKLAAHLTELTIRADNALSDALGEIRDRYEGGQPLV